MSEPPTKKNRLAEAAAALIEAASLETDSMTPEKLTENLESLKSSFADNLNRVVQKMQSSNENFNAKIKTLNQHVHDLKIERLLIKMGALKKMMEDERKQKTLEGALTLVDLISFPYYRHGSGVNDNSIKLARKVIRWFLLGHGVDLPLEATLTNLYYSKPQTNTEKELLNKGFVDKFAKQIKYLIKRKPRLVKNDYTGGYTIYYE